MNEVDDRNEGINFIDLFKKIRSKWYWFVVFGIFGLAIGYLLSKIILPKYEVKTTLLATTESKGTGLEKIFGVESIGTKNSIQNQIAILGSYELSRQVIEDLNWKIFWYQEDAFSKESVYLNYPYIISGTESTFNLPNIRIYIEQIDDASYKLSVNDKVKIDGNDLEIKFEEKGKFGKVFENKYFNFTISRNTNFNFSLDKKYFFSFNDFNDLTLDYLSKLNINIIGEDTDIIQLRLVGDNPEKGVDFLTTLNRKFISFSLSMKNKTSENTVKFIESQLEGIVDSLQIAERNYTSFRERNQTVDVGKEAGMVVQRLGELESELSIANMRHQYFLDLQNDLNDFNRMEQVAAPSVVGITDPVLNSLVVNLSELYSKRNILALNVTEMNPALIAIEKEVVNTRRNLEESLKNLTDKSNIEIINIEERKERITRQLQNLPRTEQNLISIKRDFDLNNEIYTFLLQKRAEAAITSASNTADIQVLDKPRVETANLVGVYGKQFIVIGFILGLLIPTILVILSGYFIKTIESKSDVEKITDVPIVGGITKSTLKSEISLLKNSQTIIAESFRGLRTNLQYMLTKENQKIISIQSFDSGEGKTFISVNLALIMSLNNKNVLLIGGDLRKPRLHRIFNLQNNKGLSSYLINKDPEENIITPSGIKNLDLVLSGPIPPNPAELLGNGKLPALLDNLRQKYDYIIIDNAPSLAVTDSSLVGNFSDLNLFVVRMNSSKKEHLNVINQIERQGIIKRNVIVLNSIKSNGLGYYKKYKA